MMSTSTDPRNHLISPAESGPYHLANDVLQPQVTPDARQASLPESSIPEEHHQALAPVESMRGRDVHSRPAHVSARKTTRDPSVKKLNHPVRQSSRSRNCLNGDSWALEIIAAACSICCFVAIVVVLKVYDGQRIPSLPLGITLNAIISILSTTAKSSMMFGITAAMGQSKWDRFSTKSRYHRLLDLEHIDQASRGPLGSFRMLFTQTARSIASVGAILTLLMLVVDPFVQQILLYQQESRSVSSESTWTEQVVAPTIFSNNSDPAYFGAINSALWNDDTSYERKAHCPTGNCTYPSFQSMGLCVTTREVPLDQLSFGGRGCNMTYSDTTTGQVVFENVTSTLLWDFFYPCSVYFWGDNTTSLAMKIVKRLETFAWVESEKEENWDFALDFTGPMKTDLGGQHTILGVRSPLLALGRISWSSPALLGNQSISFRFDKAEQVAIAFCAGDYLTTVVQGITSTSGSNMSSPSGFSYSDSTTILGPNATCWTSGPEKPTFPRAEIQQASHGRFIATASPLSFCTDNWGWGVDIASRLTSNNSARVSWKGAKTWYINNGSGINSQDVLQQIQSRSLRDVSTSISASLNALFRKHSSDRIIGSYIEYDTVVRVQWPWLTLPVVVELLGFTFLLWIALCNPTSRSRWKGSILAALFHGLNPSGHDTDTLDTITSMEQEATKTMVKLETSNTGKRFLSKLSEEAP